ncbi:MAG: hypothetical protein NXY57DRAFT_992943 [Lentinula lateritia]|nr:MAG: hypothetical protein NXY57DRAFT_992943 [Lentinula lateritia]
MGFFRFFDLSQPQLNSEFDISFDLTIPQTPLSKPTLSITEQCKPSRIPLELIMMIMEAAYDEEDIESNKSLLRSLALVCRDWSLSAQMLLFRHITLDSESHYRSFAFATDKSSERGRVLGNAVYSMRASLDPNQPGHLSQLNFAEAVTRCQNLQELSIGLYGCVPPGDDVVGSPDTLRMRRPAPSFDEDAIALLRTGPSITTLRFSNWSENRQSITQLLGVWISLKSLVISGTPPELPSPISAPFPCALGKLRMNFQTSPSVDFLRWLLHNSGDTLRALEFEREPSTAVLHHLIHSHHDTLTSLSLPSCSRATARVLDKCTSLRNIFVEDAISFPVALKKLSPRVEHIGFGLNKETSMQTVLEAVKTNEFLQVVTVNLRNGGKVHRQLPSLKMTCALRGIRLRIADDVRVFRGIVRGEYMP